MDTHYLTVTLRDDSVLLITIEGEVSAENLHLLKDDIREGAAFIRTQSEKVLRPLPILVDVTNLSRTYTAEALLRLAEFEKNNRTYVTRTAVFGADAKIKFAGELVSTLSGRNNIAFFDTKEEALDSLKEESISN